MSLLRSQRDGELAAGLAAIQAPFEQAQTLPPYLYTSPEIFALELGALFGRMWLCIAREEDLPQPRSYLTRRLGDEQLLVVRDEAGQLRAFFNVCRHRGARLIDAPCGRLRGAINCPYHKWSYALDGRLLHAPRAGPTFAPEDYPLRSPGLETRDGFVFINLDPGAASLAHALADLPSLARYRVGSLRRAVRHEYTIEANWKVIAENYGECYHCQLLHPQLHRISDFETGSFTAGVCFNGGPMRLRDGFTTLSMSGNTALPPIRGLTGEDLRLVRYLQVYPNLTLALHPQYLLTHELWPVSPTRSRIVCQWLVPPSTLARPGFDDDVTGMIEFWDVTNHQDWAVCERVQLGLASVGCVPGPYHQTERCVYAFDQWYAGALRQGLDASTSPAW
ncbi:aromatic ring-hydroxylating oxygenase subunit alpha [Enhygromyxa salina]|uniref:3-phenylpropionate/cinnamic acid dioxygenase subunit alpha n=1 Tax=Enhygromyxa salina TaxID=215803 RepID=A0A2S9YK89_9BACT|nr:aromatic ring-hydroxylating dioxygenase subunit alpha [Enhygromyxa salina]PRQ05519.1 3-phenylpropionate/cinnamic acid dioxygenase subunit alpha [Enhygromyxa salina]